VAPSHRYPSILSEIVSFRWLHGRRQRAERGWRVRRRSDPVDSLYGQYSTYENWIKNDPLRFAPSSSAPKRFTNIWTTSEGTLSLSQHFDVTLAASNIRKLP
jgi:hypothetical protein